MKTKMMPLVAMFAALIATPVLAGDLVFTVTNNSADALMELYASPSNEDNWGADIMAGQQVATGEGVDVTISGGSDQCSYDLRAVFANGETAESLANDLCGGAGFTIN